MQLSKKTSDIAATKTPNSGSYDKVLFYTPKEVESILQLCKHMRDTVLIKMLYDLGCTVSEIVAIQVKDIDFNDLCITIRSQEDATRTRTSFFSEEVKALLVKFLTVEKKLNARERYIFGTARGQMTTKRIQQIVKECAIAAGFKKRTNPQMLRYSHIINAHLHHVPIPAILAQTGIKRSRAIQILAALETNEVNNLLSYRKFFEGNIL